MPDQVYFNGDFWQCRTVTQAGESPATHPAKWSRLRLLKKWRWVLAQLTYAELLRLDGQTDKATLERGKAKTEEREGLDDLIRGEAIAEEHTRTGSRRGGPAAVRSGRAGYVPASVILDDVHRLIGWDAEQMDDRETADARMALSQAVQHVWEAWWWHELMQCAPVQFAQTVGVFQDFTAGNTIYSPTEDKYFSCLALVGTPPMPGGETAYRWEEYVPGKATLALWDDATAYEVFDQFQYGGVNYQCIATGATAGMVPDEETDYFAALTNWQPALPWTSPGGILQEPFGAVRGVSKWDPRCAPNPEFYELQVIQNYTRVVALDVTHPWVWARRVTPILTGDAWDAEVEYDAVENGTLVFGTTDDSFLVVQGGYLVLNP